MRKLVNIAHDKPGEDPDDLSNRVERTLIGSIGLALPVLLPLMAAWRPQHPDSRWALLSSISAYYYTGAIVLFVGLLVSLALFLFSYQGYANDWHWLDVSAARVAGIAALTAAFFPTSVPDRYSPLTWWRPWMGVVHYVSATVLFCSFAFFALFLFRRTDPVSGPDSSGKRGRNAVFLACGLAIVAAIAWTAVTAYLNYQDSADVPDRPIFVPECLALGSFAVSWLVKGRVHEVILPTLAKPSQPGPAESPG